MKIMEVYLFSNAMVMVFDEAGEQIPSLQGQLGDVREEVIRRANERTVFWFAKWNDHRIQITRSAFALAECSGYEAWL